MPIKLIAELCQNHNGNIYNLWKLLDAAVDAGATHVKLQTIFASELTQRPEFEFGVQTKTEVLAIHRPYHEEFDRLKGLELAPNVFEQFVRRCEQNNVIPMTTCFTRGQVDFILDKGFRSVKIASYDCASYQLLREVKSKFDEIVISTGASYDDEIIQASKVMADHPDWSMLHCVTIYPTPLKELHLSRLEFLKKFSQKVGYSDHTSPDDTGLVASKVAISLGAQIIERHFTVLNRNETRDGKVSVTPAEFRELVDFSKLSNDSQLEELANGNIDLNACLGNSMRGLSPQELLNRRYYRGRFATIRKGKQDARFDGIYNWEETELQT